jgi:hypothetical protein
LAASASQQLVLTMYRDVPASSQLIYNLVKPQSKHKRPSSDSDGGSYTAIQGLPSLAVATVTSADLLSSVG